MIRRGYIWLVPLCMIASLFASAGYDFTKADENYNRRGDGVEFINAAREEYEWVMDNIDDLDDKRRAVEYIGRLAYLEGELLTSETGQNDKRWNIFQKCLDSVEKINPNLVGEETPEYYFVRSICFAYRMKASSYFTKLKEVFGFRDFLESAIEKYGESENDSGIHVVLAAIISSPAACKLSRFPTCKLYDLKKAYAYLKIAAKKNPNRYIVYDYQAQVLDALGRKQDAIALLKEKIPELEYKLKDNNPKLVDNLVPEHVVYLERMRERLDKLTPEKRSVLSRLFW